MVAPKILCLPEVGSNVFKITNSNTACPWIEYQIRNLADVFPMVHVRPGVRIENIYQ